MQSQHNILKICYDIYCIRWLKESVGWTILEEAIFKWHKICEQTAEISFSDFILLHGINGERWLTEDEFIEKFYQDEIFMRSLLKQHKWVLSEYLSELYRGDVQREVINRGLRSRFVQETI